MGSTACRHPGSHHHKSTCKLGAAPSLLLFLSVLRFAPFSSLYFNPHPLCLLAASQVLHSPSPFLAYLQQTLTSSLNFIPSCSALFFICFPISHSKVCLTPVPFYPGPASTHCPCYNFLFYNKGLPPKDSRSCYLVKIPPSALPSIFCVPAAVIQLASTRHCLQPVVLLKYWWEETCWHCGASKEGWWALYPWAAMTAAAVQNYALSQQTASILFCWPRGRAESSASSRLINLHRQITTVKASAMLCSLGSNWMSFNCCNAECCLTWR